jgi:hypothetical protein
VPYPRCWPWICRPISPSRVPVRRRPGGLKPGSRPVVA